MMETLEPLKLKPLNYIGHSMHPLFKAGDRLQIVSYGQVKIREGDVVVFIPPGRDSKIVHRVTSVNSNGIRTQGDNCSHEDDWVLRRENILGRVVAAQRGNSRRRIFGGQLGRLVAVTVRVMRAVDSCISFLLLPAYNELARADIFTRLLPAQMRPRVVSFDRAVGKELQILMGRKVVGRWSEGKSGWNIRRPFRLFVDEESLPKNLGKKSVVRGQLSVANKEKVSGVGFQVSDVNEEK